MAAINYKETPEYAHAVEETTKLLKYAYFQLGSLITPELKDFLNQPELYNATVIEGERATKIGTAYGFDFSTKPTVKKQEVHSKPPVQKIVISEVPVGRGSSQYRVSLLE